MTPREPIVFPRCWSPTPLAWSSKVLFTRSPKQFKLSLDFEAEALGLRNSTFRVLESETAVLESETLVSESTSIVSDSQRVISLFVISLCHVHALH